MPDLYRLSVGSVGAAYYDRHFQRFESLGKTVPCWNNGAAFFTLAWLALRKLWRPAAIYACVLAGALALWWFALHGQVSTALEAAALVLLSVLLCAVPGFMGTGLYYHHVRQQTLRTLTSAKSLAQARALLSAQAVSPERLQVVASLQLLVALAALVLLVQFSGDDEDTPPGPPAAQQTAPQLVIPSVESIRDMPPAAEPQPEPELAQPPAPETGTGNHTEGDPQALSVLTFAQSVPQQPESAPAAAEPVPAAPAAPAAMATPAASPSASMVRTRAAPAPATKTPQAQMRKTAESAVASAAKPGKSGRLIPGKYYLNAGVYARPENVDAAEKKLRALKLGTVRQTLQGSKGKLTRLHIGPFDSRRQAEQAATRVKQLRMDVQVVQR